MEDELSSSLATLKRGSAPFVLKLFLCLIGCQLAAYLKLELPAYCVGLIVAAFYVVRRPVEILWVTFFALAAVSRLYPVENDELGTALQGAYRPYVTTIGVIFLSVLLAVYLRSSRYPRLTTRLYSRIRSRIALFGCIFGGGLIISYFGSNKTPALIDILRDCSGVITFLAFVVIGFRLSPLPDQIRQSFVRLCLAVSAYSAFFVMEFVYYSVSSGADQTASGFGYSQRNVVFFAGVVLAVLSFQHLMSESKPSWLHLLTVASILIAATLLSGSRSVLACELILSLGFLIWRSRFRLQLLFLAIVVVLIALFGAFARVGVQGGTPGSLWTYVANRYLVVSGEDASLEARLSEMVAVTDSVRQHPLLGSGPLASYSFFDPYFGWKETTFVDSGLGYLLMKTGLLGTAAFVWFSLGWLRMERKLRDMLPMLTAALVGTFLFYLAYLPFGPAFFEFQHSWFVGLIVGEGLAVCRMLPVLRVSLASAGPRPCLEL